MPFKVALLRHGQSEWNAINVFTGWTDVDLSELGVLQATRAGLILKAHGYTFDLAFTSVLKRAIRTMERVLDEMDLMHIPDMKSWRLNERHYGALQGLNKAETAEKYGDQQVAIWRRSYSTQPPSLSKEDVRHPRFDKRYANADHQSSEPLYLPDTESLEDCVARTMPYWHDAIVPAIQAGRKVIVVAHGNSLRGIVKHLDKISDEAINSLEIPVGTPLIYELDEKTMEPIRKYYVGEHQITTPTAPPTQSDGQEPLAQPSSWGLLSGVGPLAAAWMKDLARVGLVRPNGLMQLSAAAEDASKEPERSKAGDQQQPCDACAEEGESASVQTQGGYSSVDKQEAEQQSHAMAASAAYRAPQQPAEKQRQQYTAAEPAGPNTSGCNTAQPIELEGVCIDDKGALLQHSRFVVEDLTLCCPSALLGPVAQLLDAQQHTLLLTMLRPESSQGSKEAALPDEQHEFIKKALKNLDPHLKVVLIQLPQRPLGPVEASLLAARENMATMAPAKGRFEGRRSFEASQDKREAVDVSAAQSKDDRHVIVPLTKAVNKRDIEQLKLLLEYTGRPVTVSHASVV